MVAGRRWTRKQRFGYGRFVRRHGGRRRCDCVARRTAEPCARTAGRVRRGLCAAVDGVRAVVLLVGRVPGGVSGLASQFRSGRLDVVAELFDQNLACGRGDRQIGEAELQQTPAQLVVAELFEIVHGVMMDAWVLLPDEYCPFMDIQND